MSVSHLFHELNELGRLARSLVVVNELLQVVRMHDDVQTRDVGQSDLISLQTGDVHLLPGGDRVGLGGRVDGLAELVHVDVAQSQLGVVVDVREEDLGCLE